MVDIIIEGNIACGKSALLTQLKGLPRCTILPEPIEKWKNWVNGEKTKVNMLQLMYDNPKKYMRDFQLIVLKTAGENHNLKTRSRLKIMERSIYSGRYAFIEMAYHDGNLTYDEYKEVCDCFEHTKQTICQPTFIVYLRTDPKSCYDRMKKRNRTEEDNVTLEYLKKIHDYHEELLIHNQQLLPCPVIVMNANKTVEEVKEKFINFIDHFVALNI